MIDEEEAAAQKTRLKFSIIRFAQILQTVSLKVVFFFKRITHVEKNKLFYQPAGSLYFISANKISHFSPSICAVSHAVILLPRISLLTYSSKSLLIFHRIAYAYLILCKCLCIFNLIFFFSFRFLKFFSSYLCKLHFQRFFMIIQDWCEYMNNHFYFN